MNPIKSNDLSKPLTNNLIWQKTFNKGPMVIKVLKLREITGYGDNYAKYHNLIEFDYEINNNVRHI